MARIVFYKAVDGETSPPIGNPEGKKPTSGKAEAGERSITKNFSAEFKNQSLMFYRVVLLRRRRQ
jgi:hypothetical protein